MEQSQEALCFPRDKGLGARRDQRELLVQLPIPYVSH